ncbi:uncharacterized protein [Euphorbia lathyris]|uniref:uncharacterized protein isoform X2 n=1 Tax=Euphorbia lathyris TaxID=212925 RepID=UPI0033144B77
MAICLGGFTIAFAKGWLMAFVMLSTIPLLVIAAATASILVSRMATRGQSAYAEATTFVEQVAAFTGDKRAISTYNKFLQTAYLSGVHEDVASGIGLGVLMLVVFSSYCHDPPKIIQGKARAKCPKGQEKRSRGKMVILLFIGMMWDIPVDTENIEPIVCAVVHKAVGQWARAYRGPIWPREDPPYSVPYTNLGHTIGGHCHAPHTTSFPKVCLEGSKCFHILYVVPWEHYGALCFGECGKY